jgi:hypothetical protein
VQAGKLREEREQQHLGAGGLKMGEIKLEVAAGIHVIFRDEGEVPRRVREAQGVVADHALETGEILGDLQHLGGGEHLADQRFDACLDVVPDVGPRRRPEHADQSGDQVSDLGDLAETIRHGGVRYIIKVGHGEPFRAGAGWDGGGWKWCGETVPHRGAGRQRGASPGPGV